MDGKAVDRIPVCRPLVGPEEAEAAARVIRTAWLSTGSEARLLEEELSARFQAHVVAVSSASMGLMLSLAEWGVGPGDEVIVPAITFAATSNAVIHLGARPVFADIDPATGLMDADDALNRSTPKTKAIIPVDLYGQGVDITPYVNFSRDNPRVGIIRDAAQSFGTAGVGGHDGVATEVFSFYATKNVAAGEGGAIVTRDAERARKLRILSQQGVTADAYSRYTGVPIYDVVEIGFKGNLADVLAAIARVQLTKMDHMQEMRRNVCERYRRELALPTIAQTRPTNHHLYPVFVDDRDAFRARLSDDGIGTGVHFECVPGHLAYRRLGYNPEDTPNAVKFGRQEVTLPTFAGLTEAAQERVIRAASAALPHAGTETPMVVT